jgi:hypothetical protein
MMPLKKSASKEAFRANVRAEAKTKPIKQAVAIAYSVKREASKKGKK